MTRVGDLKPGQRFFADGRRWRVVEHKREDTKCVALDEPVRRGSARGLPGGTNEVERGEHDYWMQWVEVEVVK